MPVTVGILNYDFSENFRKGLCRKHCKYKESVSFSGFMGNELERGTNKSSENGFAVHALYLSLARIHSH